MSPATFRLHIGNLTIIGSDNGFSPGWRQAIIWSSAGILLTGVLEANFNKIFYRNSYIFIQGNAFESASEMVAILFRTQWVKFHDIYNFSYVERS